MRLRLFLIMVLAAVPGIAAGAYLSWVPQSYEQPDGDTIRCWASGDEFYHWMHDEQGFTIVNNPQTGYFVYAAQQDGELVPSDRVVGRDDPASAGLTPWLKISEERYVERRQRARPKVGVTAASPSGPWSALDLLVIFIRFAGDPEFVISRDRYDEIVGHSLSDTECVSNYFIEASFHDAVILDMVDVPEEADPTLHCASWVDENERNFYRPWSASNLIGYLTDVGKADREKDMLSRAIAGVHDQIPESDFYDSNGDQIIDAVAFVIQGVPDGWGEILWPHSWDLIDHPTLIHLQLVADYIFVMESTLMSTWCHEMYHAYGAPDLYSYDSDACVAGAWDLMDINLFTPQFMSSYMRKRYGGWLTIPEITQPGWYTLLQYGDSADFDPGRPRAYSLACPVDGEISFVLEYRKRDAHRYEDDLPNDGLIIYRIDQAADGQGNAHGPPWEVLTYLPDDAPSDSCLLGEAVFGEEHGRIAFNNLTNPDPTIPGGADGDVFIADIGSVADTIITFYAASDPMEMSGIVYNGIGGPWVPAANPYWLTAHVTTPSAQGLIVENGSHLFFQPNVVLRGEGTVLFQQGVGWTHVRSLSHSRSGMKVRGGIRMENNGGIRIH